MANNDVVKKIVEIGRRIGLKPDEVEDMDKFIDAVYNYVMKRPTTESERTKSIGEMLLDVARGSKALEDPVRAYYIFRAIEEQRYKEGFEDGIKLSSSKEYREVKRRETQILSSILKIYEDNIIPLVSNMMQLFRETFSGQQTQQPNIKIKFKE